jgi:hypothetical protein
MALTKCPRGCDSKWWEVITYSHGWNYRDEWVIENEVTVSHCDKCGEDWEIQIEEVG